MGERRVSEAPPEAWMRPMRLTGEADGIAGPVGARRSLDSRRATVDVSFSGGAVATVGPELRGGADRPPGPLEQPPDFLTTFTRLRSLESRYRDQPDREPADKFLRAVQILSKRVMKRYKKFIGPATQLPLSKGGMRKAERAYAALREKSRQAEKSGDLEQARWIGEELTEIDRHAARELKTLSTTFGLTASSSTRAATAPALDWCLVQPQLSGILQCFRRTRRPEDAKYVQDCLHRIEGRIRHVFEKHCKKDSLLPLHGRHLPRSVQMYRLLEDMDRRTEAAGGATRPGKIREELDTVDAKTARDLRSLTFRYGPLETLAAEGGVPVQQATGQVRPPAPAGTTAVGVVPPPQPVHPAPETGETETQRQAPTPEGAPHPVPFSPPWAPERAGTGAVAVPPVLAARGKSPPEFERRCIPPDCIARRSNVPDILTPRALSDGRIGALGATPDFSHGLLDPFSEPPGPSSRIMPAPAVGTSLGPAREQLPARRRAIVERLKSGEALAQTRSILGNGGAEALGFSPEQTRVLLEDLDRLDRFDGLDPAALADIDWVGIEALVAILDFVPPSP